MVVFSHEQIHPSPLASGHAGDSPEIEKTVAWPRGGFCVNGNKTKMGRPELKSMTEQKQTAQEHLNNTSNTETAHERHCHHHQQNEKLTDEQNENHSSNS